MRQHRHGPSKDGGGITDHVRGEREHGCRDRAAELVNSVSAPPKPVILPEPQAPGPKVSGAGSGIEQRGREGVGDEIAELLW